MARFYGIQISTFYLTSTGLVGGVPCQLAVTGVEDILTTVIGRAEPSASGVPIYQTFAWAKNKNFEIKIETWFYKSLWEDLRDLMNDALENNTTFHVIGTGDTGNFDVIVRPDPVKPFAANGFFNGKVRGANFKFITV